MAQAPLRPCAQAGCGELVRRGRCERHRRDKNRLKDERRGSRQARGYGRTWERLRELVFQRDFHLCQVCRRRTATEVDHIVGKADGGTDDLGNLQAICEGCHGLKTGREEAARRRADSARPTPGGVSFLGDAASGPRPKSHTHVRTSENGHSRPRRDG